MARRATVAVLAAAVLLLGLTAAPSAAAPVLGVNVAGIPTDAQLDAALAAGAKDVRMFVLWRDVEPTRGRLSAPLVQAYAGIAGRLAAAGARPVFVVVRTPAWASGSADPGAAPRDPRDYADFLARFAATPGIAGRGVAYQLWNEPDQEAWWTPGPDPAGYAALVRAASPAVRRADPGARVILGPLTGNNYAFLDQLYAEGIAGTFDAAAVHTDTACLVAGPSSFYRERDGRLGRFSFLGYREVRATMLAHGDDKPIWMTEFGWSSTQSAKHRPRCARGVWAGTKASGVTEARQAAFLTSAYHCMAEDPYLQEASWFTLRDGAPQSGADELRHYGLLREGGARKPAWDAFRAIAVNGDRRAGACADIQGPGLTVHLPVAGQVYAGPLRLVVSTTGGARRLSLDADGRRIRSVRGGLADGRRRSVIWWSAERLAPGAHTIAVTAYDARGNPTGASVQVVKVTPAQLLALGAPRVRVGGLHCRSLVCRVRGRATSPTGSPLPGRLLVRWQRLGGRRWRTMHKTTRRAGRPFTFRQRLGARGRWRVKVAYLPPRPLRRTGSPYRYFRVS